jgi:hypothetical protein
MDHIESVDSFSTDCKLLEIESKGEKFNGLHDIVMRAEPVAIKFSSKAEYAANISLLKSSDWIIFNPKGEKQNSVLVINLHKIQLYEPLIRLQGLEIDQIMQLWRRCPEVIRCFYGQEQGKDLKKIFVFHNSLSPLKQFDMKSLPVGVTLIFGDLLRKYAKILERKEPKVIIDFKVDFTTFQKMNKVRNTICFLCKDLS